MANLFGMLQIENADVLLLEQVGYEVVNTAVQRVIARYNQELTQMTSVFVERSTSDYKIRYNVPGGGYMQELGRRTRAEAIKPPVGWDVELPLFGIGDGLAATDIDLAYMTILELEKHMNTVMVRHTNSIRREILRAVFTNTTWSFEDRKRGTLTIQPLANGDAVLYPPIIGSDVTAIEDHYIESGYAPASIDATNNPILTIVEELEEHYGEVTGGSNVVVFIANANKAKVTAIAGFDAVNDRFIRVGNDTDVPVNLPNVPGKILGRLSGAWVVEWRRIPDDYMLGIHLDEDPPLIARVDEPGTGLTPGLQLVSQDERWPLREAQWRSRIGFGCGNRLNGVAMLIHATNPYSTPTAYARP